MWTTNPSIARLLANPEDGYRYTKLSNKRVDWRCESCGNFILSKEISNVASKGLSCSLCFGGSSYPERFVYNLLKTLVCNIVPQKEFDWSTGRVYDFYLPDYDWIIEVHGIQHYEEGFVRVGGRSLKEEQENDALKHALATENGVKRYTVIDARDSTKSHMMSATKESEIVKEFCDKEVDWKKVHQDSISSLVRLSYDMWNENTYSLEDISRKTGLAIATIKKYLREGNKVGMCEYPRVPKAQAVRDSVRRSVIQLNLQGEYVKEWDAVVDASRAMGLSTSHPISRCCKGYQHTSGGFKWVYKEDYYREVD